MEFKDVLPKKILIPVLSVIFVVGLILWRILSQAEPMTGENVETPLLIEPIKDVPLKTGTHDSDFSVDVLNQEDAAIQKQLDRDRQEQKQTKFLKTKLEQTTLELEGEKALAEINKLKLENGEAFNEQGSGDQKNLPAIKVEYIGGDKDKKEAIVSIAGINYQVKEKSSPTDNIQIVSISDSSVTLHFNAPQALTKTIEYKPE